jgi:hypothetical protein
MYPIERLNLWRPTNFKSTPSISIVPSHESANLNKIYKIELLPEPVLPTMPTFIPDCTSKDKFLTAGSKVGLYFIVTLLKQI